VLLSSGTNPYDEQGPLVPDVVPCDDDDKDVIIPHVEFATPAYVTRRCERQFYEWTVVYFSAPSQEVLSRMLICGTTSLSDSTATLGRQPVSRIVW
jgi:hypothetical protein